jgi:cardiolipin synthase A/B
MTDLFALYGRVQTDVLVPLGLVIAVIATIHVLRTKREVASAVGWIALAWFSPILGGFTYFVFGINRVERRARKLRPPSRRRPGRSAWPSPLGDGHLEPLQRAIGRLTLRSAEPGNAFQIYSNGDEAYPPMLTAIAEAQTSVGLSSYIMEDDEAGSHFIEALREAQERGIAVRVLVDGVGSGWLFSRAYHQLRRLGVPAGRFMHSVLPWRMPFLNLRTHKKILVVDGRIGFTGGMNIARDNVMGLHPPEPVQDTHFRVEGPVVEQLVEAFAVDWAFVMDEDLDGEAWYPSQGYAQPGEATARIITSGPDQDVEKVEFAVLQAIACAETAIGVMTPYFLPDERLITALAMAAMRGVAVDIVIPEKSDHRMVDWATCANIGPLLRDGCRIWRCPPPFRHSKIMVVDGEWCLIGSSNWDMRSFRLNFELCMEVYDRSLAAALTKLMEESRGKRLEPATLDARSLPVQLRDAGTRLMLPYL